MSKILLLSKQSFKQGFNDASGYRKDDPTLKNIKPIEIEELDEKFLEAKRNSVNKYNGNIDNSKLDENFTRLIKDFSYRAGILSAKNKPYPTPGLIISRAKKAY